MDSRVAEEDAAHFFQPDYQGLQKRSLRQRSERFFRFLDQWSRCVAISKDISLDLKSARAGIRFEGDFIQINEEKDWKTRTGQRNGNTTVCEDTVN